MRWERAHPPAVEPCADALHRIDVATGACDARARSELVLRDHATYLHCICGGR
jgi:hypothetical protein